MQLYLYSHIQPHSPFSSTCEPPCLPFTQRFLIAQQWLSRCEYVVVLQLWHTNPWAWVCVDVLLYGNSAEEKRHFWNHNSWNSLRCDVWIWVTAFYDFLYIWFFFLYYNLQTTTTTTLFLSFPAVMTNTYF